MRAKRFRLWKGVATALTIATVAVIVYLVMGTVSQRRAAFRAMMCFSNAKRIGLAICVYAQDNDGYLPNANHLPSRDGSPALPTVIARYVRPEDRDEDIYRCPVDRGGHFKREGLSYNYGFGFLDVGQPPQRQEAPFGRHPGTVPILSDFDFHRIVQRKIVLWADGHVKRLARENLEDYMLREP